MNLERYLRQQEVEGLAFTRLQSLHVSVVGAGAVGNEVVKNLVLMGVGRIDVHDFDHVEIHNLTRSIFLRETDVGTSKAAALVARAAQVDPNVRLRAIEGDLWRTLSLGDVTRRDVIICAVDNLEARMRLSQLCLLAGVDLVNAGIDSRHASVELFRFSAPSPCACFECHLPDSAYRKVAQRYSCGWLRRAMLAEDKISTTAITASVAGALAVQAALRVGLDAAAMSQRALIDTHTGASTVAALAHNAECIACASMWPRPRRVAAGADWQRALAPHASDQDGVHLSDALIFDYACAVCGATADAPKYIGRRADEFDDRIMRCQGCGQFGVRIDIRAEAAVAELKTRFGHAPIPVKYLLARVGEPDAVCIDLEDLL